MSSYSFSFTPLPSVSSTTADIRVEMSNPVDAETAIVEVKHGPVREPASRHLESDRALMEARSRIAAMTGLDARVLALGAVIHRYLA